MGGERERERERRASHIQFLVRSLELKILLVVEATTIWTPSLALGGLHDAMPTPNTNLCRLINVHNVEERREEKHGISPMTNNNHQSRKKEEKIVMKKKVIDSLCQRETKMRKVVMSVYGRT